MTECRHVVGLIAFNRFSINGLVGAGRHLAGQWRGRIFRRIAQLRGDLADAAEPLASDGQ